MKNISPHIEVTRSGVPKREVRKEIRSGKKTVTTRKLYPGYVFIDMVLLDENKRVIEKPWYFIRETPGIIGFVGGERPIPLRKEEVESIMSQIQDREDKVVPKVNFELGESINVNDGPFKGMSGIVEEVDQTRGKLKVSVAIFGRTTPVELEFWQVEKA